MPVEKGHEDEGVEIISFSRAQIYDFAPCQREGKKATGACPKADYYRRVPSQIIYTHAQSRPYQMTSYKLAAQCRVQRCDITCGSISSHCDYGKRMGLSFNEEIQSSYYQNTSVSVEGVSVEWVDKANERHTQYFGHWSDDSKQDASASTHKMRSELCIDGNATQLIKGLEFGGTVWKGADGAAVSYQCGKSIYGQGALSAELGITIDAQVEAPGHGKWWLDGKTGSDKRCCQQCMCAINTPEETNTNKPMSPTKWIDDGGDLIAVSPAAECVRMLNDPFRVNRI